MTTRVLEVTDDSGFMALVDPAAYESFVDEDWTLQQLFSHFKAEMAAGRLLIWGTGRGDMRNVELRSGISTDTGFREFAAPLFCSEGQLLLTNYESLTMAARYKKVRLPQHHETKRLISVASGPYQCRVVQRCDPEDYDAERDEAPDFFIELAPAPSDAGHQYLTELPWSEL